MGYAFTCDLCNRLVEDGMDRVSVTAGTYSMTGDPVLAQDLPPGGPETAGMVPTLGERLLYHPDCWAVMRAAEPPLREAKPAEEVPA